MSDEADRVLFGQLYPSLRRFAAVVADTPHRSRLLWLGAAASLVLIILGGVLAASGARSQSDTNAAAPSEEQAGTIPILHFVGTAIEPWQPMPLDPDTLIAQTRLGANEFVILFSPEQGDRLQTLGDLAPPSLACDTDMANEGGFPDSCLARPRDIQSDQMTTVPGIDGDIRLVQRTGQTLQTTATFIWDEDDVVRVAGACAPGCVKQALTLLREGDNADVLTDGASSATAGRLLVGIFIVVLGFLNLMIIRRVRPSDAW